MKGLVFVLYPLLCRKQSRKAECISGSAAASGADKTGQDEQDESQTHDSHSEDSDADEELHDYVDGVLPEALTSSYSVKSPLQKAAQLSADWMQVDGELGLANPERRFLKRLFFEHVKDREGKTESTHAMVLIPTHEEEGLKESCLAEAIMFKSGIYNNVPVPTHFVECSKKAAFGAKRAMSQTWKYDKVLQQESGTRFAASKISRGQLGEGLHEEWMKDLIRTCNTKVLYICTYGSGPCEVDVAALHVKTSVEAANANVKVCSWSHDPRKVFAEVGRARVKTILGEAYMARKMQMSGHAPVPDPGDRPERSRKLVRALLEKPLKTLNIDSNGFLLIPTADEVGQTLSATHLSDEAEASLREWRERFPRPTSQQAAPSPQPENPNPQPENPNPTPAAPPAGTQPLAQAGTHATQEEIQTKYNLTTVSTKQLPAGNSKTASENVEVVLCKTKDEKRQVWLHSKSNRKYTLQTATFLGKGGIGGFQSLVSDALSPDKKPFAWRFTRITSHKRDNAEMANAFLIYNPDGSASGGSDGKVTPTCLADIEKTLGNNVTLYGHAITRGGKTKVTITPASTPVAWIPTFSPDKSDESFSVDSLGHWLPSLEADASSGGGKFQGCHRSVFEVQGQQKPPAAGAASGAGTSWHLQPNPQPTANALYIFTNKKIEFQPNGYMALHEPL